MPDGFELPSKIGRAGKAAKTGCLFGSNASLQIEGAMKDPKKSQRLGEGSSGSLLEQAKNVTF